MSELAAYTRQLSVDVVAREMRTESNEAQSPSGPYEESPVNGSDMKRVQPFRERNPTLA